MPRQQGSRCASRAPGRRHDLREADGHSGRLRHQGRLRQRQGTGETDRNLFAGRVRHGRREPVYDHGVVTDPIMSPAWSPDSRQLAYVSFEDDVSTIFVQTLQDRQSPEGVQRAGHQRCAAFSPDGRKLVLTLGRRGRQPGYSCAGPRIARADPPDDQSRHRYRGHLVAGRSDTSISRPTGSGGPQIYRVGIDGGHAGARDLRGQL